MSGNSAYKNSKLNEEYRKITDFVNDPAPVSWTMKALTAVRGSFKDELDKVLDDYLLSKVTGSKNADYCIKKCAEVFSCRRKLYLKLGLKTPAADSSVEYTRSYYYTMVGNIIDKVKDCLPPELCEENAASLRKKIFDAVHTDDMYIGGQTPDDQYEKCVRFIKSPEQLPPSVGELLMEDRIIGNPIEHIIDEKSIRDILSLNAEGNLSDDDYINRCAFICAENYGMKMAYNRKLGRDFLKISERTAETGINADNAFFISVKEECIRRGSAGDPDKYRYFDWDLMYKYVFSGLHKYFNKNIAELKGLTSKKGGEKTRKKRDFILTVYDYYYNYFVVPDELIKVFRDGFSKEKADALSKLLCEKEAVMKNRNAGEKFSSPYRAYITVTENKLGRNRIFQKNRFATEWYHLQQEEYGGLHIIRRPDKVTDGRFHFKIYPPRTMDEIYIFCLMLNFPWESVVRITGYAHDFYEAVSNGKYREWPEYDRDFITRNYITKTLGVRYSLLKPPEADTDSERDRMIRRFFTETYISDYAKDTGSEFCAAGLIRYLNGILELKGLAPFDMSI